jgi:hypothetical protein
MSIINLGDLLDSALGSNGYGSGLLGGNALLGNLLGNGGSGSGLLGGLLGNGGSGSGLLGGLLGNGSGSGLLGDLGLGSVVNPGSGNMATSGSGSVSSGAGSSSTSTSTILTGGNLLGSEGLLGGLLGIL